LRPLPLISGADAGGSDVAGGKAKQFELRVTLKAGEVLWLTEASTNNKSVNGLRSDGTAVSIPLEQISSVERRERSLAKTAALVVVGVAAVVVYLHVVVSGTSALVAAP
jgi:hypothetical protein